MLRTERYFCLSALFLEITIELCLNLMDFVEKERKMLICSIGIPFQCEKQLKRFRDILGNVDVLVVSLKEFVLLSPIFGLNRLDMRVFETPVVKFDGSSNLDTNGERYAFVGGFLASLVQEETLGSRVQQDTGSSRSYIRSKPT